MKKKDEMHDIFVRELMLFKTCIIEFYMEGMVLFLILNTHKKT